MPTIEQPSPLLLVGVHEQPRAQCVIGSSLRADFFEDSHRFMLGVIASALFLLGASTGVGILIGMLSDIAFSTAVLATAPGGLAEMALTARVLKLGVPAVTAFHTFRLALVVISAGPVYRLLASRTKRRSAD